MRVSQFNAVPLAMATTLGLLLLMASLINTEFETPPSTSNTKSVSVIMPKMKVDTILPQAPEKPLPPVKAPPEPVDAVNTKRLDGPVITEVPPPGPGTGPVISRGGLIEGDFMPLVQVAPEYPRAAANRGIEGFATVEFTVTTTGSTRNVVVIDAIKKDGTPTSIFDRAAVQAAERFKYQPRVEDGIAIEVHGVKNRFVFELAD